MKDLIILGAGGAAMDILSIVNDINKENMEWNIVGYLDDNKLLYKKDILGKKVIGTIDDCVNYKNAYYISSIAHPKNRSIRNEVFNRVSANNLKFGTIIHPSTVIMAGVVIGEGTIIRANCVIGSSAVIKKDVSISNNSTVSHESIIFSHTTLAAGVKISSGVIIGESCYIGCGVSTTHDIQIDPDITIGVGSAVVSNINNSAGHIWIGVPSKPIANSL